MDVTTARRPLRRPRLAGAPGAAARRLVALAALALLTLFAAYAPSAGGAEPSSTLAGTARAASAVPQGPGPSPSQGAIAGEVTDASSHAPVQGIEVCATNLELIEEEEGEEEEGRAFGCTTTGANGGYEISELIPEEGYTVLFKAPATSQLNYIAQYYDDVFAPAEPTSVTVIAGKTISGVDAALTPGARIAGTVTAATTGKAIEEVLVAAVRPSATGSLEVASYTHTGAGGRYTLLGLASGSYDVVFVAPGYLTQYYDGKATAAEATAVDVTAPRLTSPLDAAMRPGTSVVPAFAYTPSSATPPGKTPAGGVPGTTLAGGTQPPAAALSLAGTRIGVRRNGVALITVACSQGTTCQGRITLRMAEALMVNGKTTRREIAIGKSPALTVAYGQTAPVKIKLAAAGLKALSAGHWHLVVELALADSTGTHDESVVLTTPRQASQLILTRVPVYPAATPAS